MTSRNDMLFERAQRTIPAGVNSPVRAFRSVGGTPRFFTRGEGAYLWDADGKRYIDYVGSWGPAILGHAHADTVRAVQETAVHGLSFGAPTELERDRGGIARRPVGGVHIAADGGHRRDPAECRDDLGPADVAGMDDVGHAGEVLLRLGAQQAVRVRNDSDPHGGKSCRIREDPGGCCRRHPMTSFCHQVTTTHRGLCRAGNIPGKA